LNFLDSQIDENRKFVTDKIFHPLDAHFDTNSLSAWLSYYYAVHVKGAPEKTEQAKKNDVSKFIQFFQTEFKSERVFHNVFDTTMILLNHVRV